MRIDELTPELLEKAKKCESYEERMAFISENEIELSDEQMEALSGGGGKAIERGLVKGKIMTCRECKEGQMVKTGRTKPGKIFGDFWPDEEWKCNSCGFIKWI